MSAGVGLRWKRILLGALLIELTMFAIVIPLSMVSESAAYYTVPLAGCVTAALFGRWVAAKAGDRFLLHGALTATAASLMWLTLVVVAGGMATTPVLYHVTNVVRVLAGAAGGIWAQRHAGRPALPAATL